MLNISEEILLKNLCKTGLVVGLIMGRAIAPKRKMTLEQLSSILFGFVGNMADIIGLFDSYNHPTITYNRTVRYVVLGLFTWSIYQFTIVLVKPNMCKRIDCPDGLTREDGDKCSHGDALLVEKEEATVVHGPSEADCRKSIIRQKMAKYFHTDVCAILVLLLMHDGPFMILRILLTAKYDVTGEMHLFFTIKNTMAVVLLLYRLFSVCCCESPEDLDD